MIYIKLRQGTNEIESVHYMPFDEKYGLHKTQEELLQNGYLVDAMPPENPPEGYQVNKLLFNSETQTISYEYAEVPQSAEEIMLQKITNLETQIDTLLGV